MIVNYDKKFIFVGLPFSACSAISKELLEQYQCETLLHKHANIPALLLSRPDINIKNFDVVAVVRDPVETSLTLYHWLKNNRYEHFTKAENFFENGGTVTRHHRKLYALIQKRDMTFQQYLDHCFRFIPYDSLLSENIHFLTKIIRYDHLQDDFRSCFRALGLEINRDLPIYNQTAEKENVISIDEKRLTKYFGPYLLHNAAVCQHLDSYNRLDFSEISKVNSGLFFVLRKLKSYYRLRYDMRLSIKNISHID